jgi:hypothetical protein
LLAGFRRGNTRGFRTVSSGTSPRNNHALLKGRRAVEVAVQLADQHAERREPELVVFDFSKNF